MKLALVDAQAGEVAGYECEAVGPGAVESCVFFGGNRLNQRFCGQAEAVGITAGQYIGHWRRVSSEYPDSAVVFDESALDFAGDFDAGSGKSFG